MSEVFINPVIIFGAKGIGKLALEIFKSNKVLVYGFLDDDESIHQTEFDHISVLGNTEHPEYIKLIGKKCDAFVASDENAYRKSIIEMLRKKRQAVPINAFHPKAILATHAQFGHGNLVNMGATVGAGANIGNHCILHANALIDYEAIVEDFVQIGAGSVINAKVKIEEGAFIGSGVTVVSGVNIGKNARVGAGSVVLADVEEEATVFGNPAKPLKV